MKRHFTFFANGGPFPGTCLSCGYDKELFDLGGTRAGGGNNLLCIRCSRELAEFMGFADKATFEAEIESLKAALVSRETELNKVPNLVDGLINGIRSSVTDFIFAVSYSSDSNQHEPVQDSAGASEGTGEAGEAASRQRKASSKPASH